MGMTDIVNYTAQTTVTDVSNHTAQLAGVRCHAEHHTNTRCLATHPANMRTHHLAKQLFTLVLAGLLFAAALPSIAHAATDFYTTWKDYKAGESVEKATWNIVSDGIDQALEAGKELFKEGDLKAAYDAVNAGYYGFYETSGFERTVMGYIGNGRVSQIELQFSAAKAVAKKEGSYEDFVSEVDKLSSMIREDAHTLDGTTPDGSTTAGDGAGAAGAAATFAACFGIIVREGVEAILVIGAIIAYLVKSGNQKSLKSVYIGAALGVVASFVAAWLLDQLKLSNAAPQEIIEGVTALIAVVVLYYVSNWMLSKSETEAWNSYIENQVASSVETGSSFALVFTAWLAVFREGAEVILFFQPMLAGDNINMVWAGFVVGCLVLVVIFIAMRFFSVRLPLKPFFTAMSILMFIMAISFLGSGIKELIEGDVLTMTPIPWIPSNEVLEVLGIYPAVETVVPQLILLAITVVIFVVQKRRAKSVSSSGGASTGASPVETATA